MEERWVENPLRCEAITQNGTRCQKIQNFINTMKSPEGDFIRVCNTHRTAYEKKNYKKVTTTRKNVEDLTRFDEEDQAFHEQMQAVRRRKKQNQPMQQMLVPEALPKPAFVTVAQFQQILGLIEKRHYPKNKQTVIQVALDEGFVQQDNNFQSKVEQYVVGVPLLLNRFQWTDPLRQWKRDIQETELQAGGKLLTLRRAFNQYAQK